ncbi:MAG: GTP-dependent dephospho-CoA kinase family protein [Candidatus Methanosuratincola petrocarbonis]
MGYLKLPESLRQELAKEYGILLAGSPVENAARAIELFMRKCPPKVIVVGDFTLKTLIDHGFVPDLAIYDRKTKRSGFWNIDLPPSCTVKNPPGTITDEAFSAIKVALESKGRNSIYVEGEEDLLSIPAILLSPVGSVVVYGMPDRGMVLVEADSETKNRVRSILDRFERVE